MAGFDDAEMDFDHVMDRVNDDDDWMECMDPMEEAPPEDMFMDPHDEAVEFTHAGIVEPGEDAASGDTMGSQPRNDDSAPTQSNMIVGSVNDDDDGVVVPGRNDPVLPMADDVESGFDSADRPPTALQAAKRRRISGKQGFSQEHKDAVAALELRRLGIQEAYENMSASKRTIAQNHVRIHLCRHMKKVSKGHEVILQNGVVLHCGTVAEYDNRQTEVRKKLLFDLAHTSGLPEGASGWAAKRWLQAAGEPANVKQQRSKISDKSAAYYIKSNMALLTCHGDFGVSKLSQLPPHTYTVTLLEKWCRRQPEIVSAWDAVSNKILSVQQRYKVTAIAFALEVCTRTWASNKQLKLHLHAWLLQHKAKQRLPLNEFQLEGSSAPFVSGIHGRDSRGISAFAGCYYVCCAKIGQVFKYTTKEPHIDFAVKPEWVIRMYAADKMTVDHAKDDLVRQVTRASDYLEQLTFHEQWREARAEEAERMRVLSAVMASAKPPRFPTGVLDWQNQWAGAVTLDRYKFLVLDSKSRMGKTRFVQNSLVDSPEQALILDCADAVVPALKGNYVRSKHPLIMFDEAHAEMVIRCKKLFQASMNPVTYGSSPTNAYVHTVWLHGVKMVIGSNCWAEELSKLADPDREWIKTNSVYVYIDAPLWIE